MGQEVLTHSSSEPLPVELLCRSGWPPAAQLFWSGIGDIQSVPRDDLAGNFWSGKKERSKAACRTLADLLFAAGRGEEALAALMLAADPTEPQTFEIMLPQLTYAIEHLWDWPVAGITRQHALARLTVWCRAARGDFENEGSSIFWITRLEMLNQEGSSEGCRRHATRTSVNRNTSRRNPAHIELAPSRHQFNDPLRVVSAGDAKLTLRGCADDRRIIWRPLFIALRLLT